jgi:hypothetical protein
MIRTPNCYEKCLPLYLIFQAIYRDGTFFNNCIVRAGLWVATHNPAAAAEIVLPLGINPCSA